jgi:predicted nucleotidyltransferase
MKQDFKAIITLLQEAIPDLTGVYLFGSRANQTASPASDYDFAFLTRGSTPDGYSIFRLQQKIAQMLHSEVDLIDLARATTVLQFQIVSKGQRIYASDLLFCDEFDLYVFSAYQHLNESQQSIIDNIVKTGQIYA